MDIKVTDEGAGKTMQIIGRLDTNTSPKLEEAVGELYAAGVNDIVVDLAECDFVSSAGLRVIGAMQKRATAGGSLVFRNVQPDVMDVFSNTGFDKILTFV